MDQLRLDHVVIAVFDFERSNRFCAEVLGAEAMTARTRFELGTDA